MMDSTPFSPLSGWRSGPDQQPPELSPVKRALQEIRELKAKLAQAEQALAAVRTTPIAIVGMGMRFPGGVSDATSLWDLLQSGRDPITEIPCDRWDWRSYFDSNPEVNGAMTTIRGGFLNHVDCFDAEFFGIAPREARMLDPQQRLLLEVAWHACEDAGIAPDQLRKSQTGIFIGLSNFDYFRAAFLDDAAIDAYAGSGQFAQYGRWTAGLHSRCKRSSDDPRHILLIVANGCPSCRPELARRGV